MSQSDRDYVSTMTFMERCIAAARDRDNGVDIETIRQLYGWRSAHITRTAISRGRKPEHYAALLKKHKLEFAQRRRERWLQNNNYFAWGSPWDERMMELLAQGVSTRKTAEILSREAGHPFNKNHIIGRSHRLRAEAALVEEVMRGIKHKGGKSDQ